MSGTLPGFEDVVTGHDGTRRADDYYATPRSAVDAVMPVLRHRIKRRVLRLDGTLGPRPLILEPASGHGSIQSALAAERTPDGMPRWQVVGIELDALRAEAARRDGLTVWQGDFLTEDWSQHLPVRLQGPAVVGNPPYEFAIEFVERAIAVARGEATECTPMACLSECCGGKFGWGPVAMLLRMGFQHSQGRAAFHRENPCDVLVLDKRPSFTGGRTDSCEYGWYIWPPIDASRWPSGRTFGLPMRGTIWREGDFDGLEVSQ